MYILIFFDNDLQTIYITPRILIIFSEAYILLMLFNRMWRKPDFRKGWRYFCCRHRVV
ncbi:hypothetical protein NEISICOT_00052 [Neisseria sicca ATCC 29256]|uniref:Uncharacterized protein n=1 Tax=Neisseria sicca ATCC 29256 TaxID=547045 RepID=C6M0M7_NEISI|nr:hypothetical protein NEISICOT_00052 [Neisseria sicca ATCC 29256]